MLIFWTTVHVHSGGGGALTPCSITSIVPDEVKVDLADFDIKLREILLCSLVNNNTYSCRNVLLIFFHLLDNFKKWHFDVHFNDITSKVQPLRYPPPPPLLLGFTVISDHPRAGEVPNSCGMQSGGVPVRIPISFQSQAVQSAGGGGFSVRNTFLLFLSELMVPQHSSQSPETRALCYTPTNPSFS